MIFALSDLHLPFGIKKPMDIFGGSWENYVEKIEHGWNKVVKNDDCVILPGDISWAMNLLEAEADFDFIERLPGLKLISKGNHDYWWTTIKKMEEFISIRYNTIHILHNSAYLVQDVAVCASRGWIMPDAKGFTGHSDKIYKRELARMELSLQCGDKLGARGRIAALHYPPDSAMIELMEKYGVKACVFGHLHGNTPAPALASARGIEFILVSCDRVDFTPVSITI